MTRLLHMSSSAAWAAELTVNGAWGGGPSVGMKGAARFQARRCAFAIQVFLLRVSLVRLCGAGERRRAGQLALGRLVGLEHTAEPLSRRARLDEREGGLRAGPTRRTPLSVALRGARRRVALSRGARAPPASSRLSVPR